MQRLNAQTKITKVFNSDLVHFNDIKISLYANQTEAVSRINKILESVCVKYFGMYVDMIPDVVVKSAITVILQRYQNLTIREIEHSFDRVFENLAKQVTITVENLITPINNYFIAKSQIEKESRKLLTEISEEKLTEEKVKAFETDCIKAYNECLSTGIWTGSIFMCNFLAEKLKHNFTLEQKQKWWEDVLKIEIITDDTEIYMRNIGKFIDKKEKYESEEKYRQRKKDVYTRLMAEKIIIESLKTKIELK